MNLGHSGKFHDRGFPLPFCKAECPFSVRVNPSESVTALKEHGHLPVVMLPAFVFAEFRGLQGLGQGLAKDKVHSVVHIDTKIYT